MKKCFCSECFMTLLDLALGHKWNIAYLRKISRWHGESTLEIRVKILVCLENFEHCIDKLYFNKLKIDLYFYFKQQTIF